MRIFTIALSAALSVGVLTAPGFSDEPAEPVNEKCPISKAGVDAKYTVSFDGKTVGFCCPNCPKAWEKLTNAQKKEKLAAVMPTGPVNETCPIMGGDVNAKVTTQWKGKTVGFCCKPCIAKWNALSEEKKADKLKAATKKEADDVKIVNAKCPIMGNKAGTTTTVEWNGKTVGFCCPPCVPKWNALSEVEKAKKLAAAMK